VRVEEAFTTLSFLGTFDLRRSDTGSLLHGDDNDEPVAGGRRGEGRGEGRGKERESGKRREERREERRTE